MARYAIVITSEHGEGNPGGQGRTVHALSAARELAASGDEVSLWFHGIGVGWLSAFSARYDAFTRNYGALFDEVRPLIGGACNFCASKRFGAAESAEQLGIPLVGGDGEHHTVATLVREGWQVLTL